MKNFKLIGDVNIQTFFSSIDLFFANYFKPESEDEAVFLSYLFMISRNGFVSLLIENNEIYPKPTDLNFEESLDIDIDILMKKIIYGSENILEKSYLQKSFEIFPQHPIVKFENYFYLQKNFVFENFIIKNLKRLILSKPEDFINKQDFFDRLLGESSLLEEQKHAIRNVYDHSVSFIVGGPGCGKTYLASFLINFFSSLESKEKKGLKIIATSFTGKATSHLKKTITKNFPDIIFETKTLHLLLSIKEKKNKYFDKDKLDFDLVIVDEASMIDISLFSHLLDSIKDGARIVFIGDPNQLPPIESGNVFYELINLKIIPTVNLKKPIRFENNIILNIAKSINEEDLTIFNQLLNQINFTDSSDYKLVKNVLFEEAKKKFYVPADSRLNIEKLFEDTNKFRILSSVRKGVMGVDQLNEEIFSYFFRQSIFNQFLYIPIMITKNHYDLDLFNGDLGILEYKLSNKNESKAFFRVDEKIKEFGIYSLKNFEYAYVISIHKSQGSEFESAIVILPEIDQIFGKELVYTGITRVKSNLHIISTKNYLYKMISKSSLKKSGFSKRFIQENII